MTQQHQKILERCKQIVEKAKALYGIDLSRVQVRFDLKGRAAGKASGKRYRDPVISNYAVKFNHDMLGRDAFDHVYKDTVPHEYAHILCFINPSLGKNHDSGWEQVCLALGGNGNRTHKEEVVYGKGATYEYVTDRGHKVRLSEKMHNQVQNIPNSSFRYRRGLGTVTKQCHFVLVGVSGRSIAPVAPKVDTRIPAPTAAVNSPAKIEEAIHQMRAATPAPKPAVFAAGNSKASIARAIMLSGYNSGKDYETIIAAIMAATGHDRQLARATYKANAAKVGIPQ